MSESPHSMRNFYRVSLRDRAGMHIGYEWFGDKRDAKKYGNRWRKTSDGGSYKIEPVQIAYSRKGLVAAFNNYAGHPDNG